MADMSNDFCEVSVTSVKSVCSNGPLVVIMISSLVLGFVMMTLPKANSIEIVYMTMVKKVADDTPLSGHRCYSKLAI